MLGAAAREDVFRLLASILADRYRVDAQIAEGGFAVVYQACQVALDRRVALKVLKTPVGYDEAAREEFCERFAAEARTIARLKHPSIVDVYDFAISPMPSGDLAPWMALEWVDGASLEAWLARRRRDGQAVLEPREAVDLLRPALQALAFAHHQGVVHRDVKPANIMVVENDHGRTVRVLDFGIAKMMEGEEPAGTGRTRTGSVPAFSPAYAAPEQVTFSRTGPWTDVHALGLILTELLTGEAPFTDPEASVHEQVMAAERPTPARRGRSVGRLEAVIARAVALAPGERWRNAGELLAALDAAVADPAPRPGRSRAAVAGAVIAAALAAAVGLWALRGRPAQKAPAPPPAPVASSAARTEPPAPPPPPAPVAVVPASAAAPPPVGAAARRKKIAPKAAARTGAKRADLFDDPK